MKLHIENYTGERADWMLAVTHVPTAIRCTLGVSYHCLGVNLLSVLWPETKWLPICVSSDGARDFENIIPTLTSLWFYLNKFFFPSSLQSSCCTLLLIVVDVLQSSSYLPVDHPPQEAFVCSTEAQAASCLLETGQRRRLSELHQLLSVLFPDMQQANESHHLTGK